MILQVHLPEGLRSPQPVWQSLSLLEPGWGRGAPDIPRVSGWDSQRALLRRVLSTGLNIRGCGKAEAFHLCLGRWPIPTRPQRGGCEQEISTIKLKPEHLQILSSLKPSSCVFTMTTKCAPPPPHTHTPAKEEGIRGPAPLRVFLGIFKVVSLVLRGDLSS